MGIVKDAPELAVLFASCFSMRNYLIKQLLAHEMSIIISAFVLLIRFIRKNIMINMIIWRYNDRFGYI